MNSQITSSHLIDSFCRNAPDSLEITKNFISLNKDIDSPKEYYSDTLRFASIYGHFDSLSLLLDAGADILPLNFSPLHKSIIWGTIEDIKAKLTMDTLEKNDAQGRTPFLLAVHVGSLGKVKLLVESGANIYASNPMYHSALMYAVANNDTIMLQYLIDLGLDINAHNSDYNGTALYMASDLGYIEGVQLLLSFGAKLEYQYESKSGVDENETYISEHKVIDNALTMEVVNILIEAGADIKDISGSMRKELLGLDSNKEYSLSKEDYTQYKGKLFGESNPERMTNPFNLHMIKSNKWAGTIANNFDDTLTEPIWCAERYGRSITVLDDGRIVEIGGEHEDYYVPEFCIYNDVIVYYPDKSIEIYGYPKDIFPPTDSHTATLVGDSIYIIGNLSYPEERNFGFTPVYRLNLSDYSIEKVQTTGEMAGWIYKHKAFYDGKKSITISDGTIIQGSKGLENREKFVLDLETLKWSLIGEIVKERENI